MYIKISSSGTSFIGKQSKINEDNFYMNGLFQTDEMDAKGATYSDETKRRIQFYAVFDGIGNDVKSDLGQNFRFSEGHSSVNIAINMLSKLQHYLKKKDQYDLNHYLSVYTHKVNTEICNFMTQNKLRSGLSYAALCVDKNVIKVYNVGNCKVYMLRENRMSLLSVNDTRAQNLVAAKMLSEDIARNSPENSILTQHLGMFENERVLEPHIYTGTKVKNGDKFLLCSDSLCDSLTKDRIYQILSRDISEQEIVNDMITEAMQNGGKEDISAVVVGVSYVDDGAGARNNALSQLQSKPNNLKPLSYKRSFKFKREHMILAGIIALAVFLFVLFITFMLNGPLKKLEKDDDPSGTTPNQSLNAGLTSENDLPLLPAGNGTDENTTANDFSIPTISDAFGDETSEGETIEGETTTVPEAAGTTEPEVTTKPQTTTKKPETTTKKENSTTKEAETTKKEITTTKKPETTTKTDTTTAEAEATTELTIAATTTEAVTTEAPTDNEVPTTEAEAPATTAAPVTTVPTTEVPTVKPTTEDNPVGTVEEITIAQ